MEKKMEKKVLNPVTAKLVNPVLASRSNFDLSAIVWRLWRPIVGTGMHNKKMNDSSLRVIHRLWFWEVDSAKVAKEVSGMKDIIMSQIKDSDVLMATFQKADLERRVNTTKDVTPDNKVILYMHAKVLVSGKEVKERLGAIMGVDGVNANLKGTSLKDSNYVEYWEHERASHKGGSKQKTQINFTEA